MCRVFNSCFKDPEGKMFASLKNVGTYNSSQFSESALDLYQTFVGVDVRLESSLVAISMSTRNNSMLH